MKKTELYVSLGSSNLVISVLGSGIILREPSLVAVDIETEKIIEWGTKAKKMLGKTTTGIDVFSPIERGIIKHKNYASKLFGLALSKVFGENMPKKISLHFVIRVGLTEQELSILKQIANENDIGEVYFDFKPILALKGAGVNTTSSSAYLSLTIGGGATNIAVISHNKILSGLSVSLGGKDLDLAICEHLLNTYDLEISVPMAEKIKTYCGSLILQDTSNMEVMGVDSKTKEPKKEIICANDVRHAVIHFFEYLVKVVQEVINSQSPDIVADIIPNGIYLSGGTASLGGIQEYFYDKLNIVVHSFENPENNPYLV